MSEDPDWSLTPVPPPAPPATFDCGHPALPDAIGHGHVRLALAQWPVAPVAGLAAWFARVESWVNRAAGSGAQLAVLPEMAVMEAAPSLMLDPAGGPCGEVATMAALSARVLEGLRAVALRSGLWLLGGSLPLRQENGLYHNTAVLIAPDGTLAFQDKCVLTDADAAGQGFVPGAAPGVFDTPFGRLGVSIGDDITFPKHVRAQVEAGAWLILVPARATTLHAFNRLRFSAAARALENQCFVGLATTVGAAPWSGTVAAHRGHAAVFCPVDTGFPEDGLLARGAQDMAQWVFCDLDTHGLDSSRARRATQGLPAWPRAPFPPCLPARFT